MATQLHTVTGFRQDGDVGADPTSQMELLRGYIDNELEEMSRFRDHIGLTTRLDNCLRLREGQYDAAQLAAIRAYGGSQIFARLTTNKIRGATAMLRSIFIQGDRPWDVDPTPVPSLPEDIESNISDLVMMETQGLVQAGQQPDPAQIKMRVEQLTRAAQQSARRQSRIEAIESARYIDDILVEGDFYKALNQFLLDFATYPCAVLAGPTAVMKTGVEYVDGQPVRARKPVLTYRRVDLYDIMWAPGARELGNANIIELLRLNRADVNALIGLDGYDEDALLSVLREYGDSGYHYEQFASQVHDDSQNQGGIFYRTQIEVLAYTGTMSGRDLDTYGLSLPDDAPIEDDLEYQVQAWVCGRYILKAQVDPDPSNRTPYYSAAYEPVAGSIVGTALCELFSDVQEGYNATARGLVNNIAFASGPMVGLNRDRWQAPNDQVVRIQPLMIWQFESDPSATAGEKPIEFYQPNLNAQELISTLSFFQNLADEISGIPRYLTGSDKIGGAGRTSSGLSMLMGNATRTMTSVAGGIDEGVIEPVIQKTYTLVQVTTGTTVLRGDEKIRARGATFAEERETDRMRAIELLQLTANPYDMQIMGMNGRAALLRGATQAFVRTGEEVVPPEDAMLAMQQQQMGAGQAGVTGQVTQPGGPPNGSPQPGGSQPAPSQGRAPPQEQARGTDNAMRVRSQGAVSRQAGGGR